MVVFVLESKITNNMCTPVSCVDNFIEKDENRARMRVRAVF